MTIREVLINIRERLQNAGIEDFEYESWAFLDWKLHIDRAEFYMNPNGEVKEELLAELESVLKQREQRVPLQYLMGECEFMGYDFYLDERVLIPRQDTECLVEEVLRKIKPGNFILDVCTGSGCIIISIQKLMKDRCHCFATDISEEALKVARKNAEQLNADITFWKGDLFESVDGRFDCIVSNPPYIESEVIQGLEPEVREHEPILALDGKEDGLFFYRKIVKEAKNYLQPGGWLLFEIGYLQGSAVTSLLEECGYQNITVKKDLAGLDRIVLASLKK